MKVVYIYVAQSLKMGRLRERPLNENGEGGFQSGPSLKNEGILELKITSHSIFFFKWGSFGAALVGKVEYTNVYFWKGSLLEQSRSKKWSL